MAVIAAGAIAGAAALGGGFMSSNASKNAANKQQTSAAQALQLQRDEFNQSQANLQPWMTAGGNSLAQLQRALGIGGGGMDTSSFVASPGYNFQMQQGLDATTNALSRSGGANSGNTLKALTQYGQGVANQGWQQYLQNLMQQSGAGQNAAAGLGGFAANYANSAGNLMTQAGNAAASGIVGGSNAMTGGINSAAQAAMLAAMMQNSQTQTTQPSLLSTADPANLLASSYGYGGVNPS